MYHEMKVIFAKSDSWRPFLSLVKGKFSQKEISVKYKKLKDIFLSSTRAPLVETPASPPKTDAGFVYLKNGDEWDEYLLLARVPGETQWIAYTTAEAANGTLPFIWALVDIEGATWGPAKGRSKYKGPSGNENDVNWICTPPEDPSDLWEPSLDELKILEEEAADFASVGCVEAVAEAISASNAKVLAVGDAVGKTRWQKFEHAMQGKTIDAKHMSALYLQMQDIFQNKGPWGPFRTSVKDMGFAQEDMRAKYAFCKALFSGEMD